VTTATRNVLTEAAARTIAESVPTSIDTAYIFPAKAAERQLIVDTVTSEILAASRANATGADAMKTLRTAAQNTTDTVMSARRSAAASTREYFSRSVLFALQRALRGAHPDWYEQHATTGA